MRTTCALLAISLYLPIAAISQDAAPLLIPTPEQAAAIVASHATTATPPAVPAAPALPSAVAAPLYADSSEASIKDALASMVHRSGVIVAGDISHVASRCLPLGATREGAIVTEITIRATSAIRGVMPGQSFTFRNAAAGCDPAALAYRVGDHLLLMLQPVDPMGVSAPVDEAAGIIHVDATGEASLSGLHEMTAIPETALLQQLSLLATARVPPVALAHR